MQMHKLSLSLPFLIIALTLLQQTLLCKAQNSPQDFLDAHNAVRSLVGVGPIFWDPVLEAFAIDYVNQLTGDCNLVHSESGYGENLAAGTDNFSGVQAVELWASEAPYYDEFLNMCIGGECLHYTQIVWRDSIALGCARAQCANGLWWIVSCNYAPPGNILGERPY